MLWNFKEFRTLAAYRIYHYDSIKSKNIRKLLSKAFGFLYRGQANLYIDTEKIGSRLFIQHGFSTIISADSIGKECWINQQVTIGREQCFEPTIGNHVRICARAIIIGNVTIGNNSTIGAGAVVTKNVPPIEILGGATGLPHKACEWFIFWATKLIQICYMARYKIIERITKKYDSNNCTVLATVS